MPLPDSVIVLLVEDDDAIRDNLVEILEDEGYRCWAAPTADAALRLLESELRGPDIILLDLWMPGMRVDAFVSRLKERAAWSRAPVVLTTAADPASIPAALAVDRVLLKPFHVEALLAVITAALRPREGDGASPT